jgi:hypothetical protein
MTELMNPSSEFLLSGMIWTPQAQQLNKRKELKEIRGHLDL